MSRCFRLFGVVLLVLSATLDRVPDPAAQVPTGVVVRVGAGLAPQPLDGRLLLLISKDGSREPRFQVSATSLSSAQVFGLDVEGLKAGDEGGVGDATGNRPAPWRVLAHGVDVPDY